MLEKYVFLALFVNMPLIFGYTINYIQHPPCQESTCTCNCNFPKPKSYVDSYGQQTMVCIPVPITIQGMYPQTTGRSGSGFLIEQKQSGDMASADDTSYGPGGVPGGLDPATNGQQLPGAASKPVSLYFLQDTPQVPAKPAFSSDPYLDLLFKTGGPEGIPVPTSTELPFRTRKYDSPPYHDLINDYIID